MLHAVGGKSPRTADTYATQARLFTDWLTADRPAVALIDVTRDDIEDYLIDLADRGVAQATRRLAVYGLGAFYDLLSRNLTTPANPAKQVRPPAQPRTKTVDYSGAELIRMIAAAATAADTTLAKGLTDRRIRARFDHAVLATFRYTGVRLAELRDAHTTHVDLARRRLEVTGKGSKQRYIPLPAPLVTILTDYLADIRPLSPHSAYLFANPDGYPGSAVYGRLAQRAAFDIVVKYAEAARLTGQHHPHRLRHSYATDLLRRGASLETIRKLLGHASTQTTIRYLHITQEDVAAAIDQAFPADIDGDDPTPGAA